MNPKRPRRASADKGRAWYPDLPERSSRIKPMPAIGCPGKFFRDVITRGHSGIDTSYEHSTRACDGKGPGGRTKIKSQ